MSAIKSFVIYALMLIAAAINNKKMQDWLDCLIWADE